MSEGEAVGLIRQVFICRQYFHSEKTCHHHCLLWLIITAHVKFTRWEFLSSNINHPNDSEHSKVLFVKDATMILIMIIGPESDHWLCLSLTD